MPPVYIERFCAVSNCFDPKSFCITVRSSRIIGYLILRKSELSWNSEETDEEKRRRIKQTASWLCQQGSQPAYDEMRMGEEVGKDDEEDGESEEQVYPAVALARLMVTAPQKRGWLLWGKRPDSRPVSPRSTNWSSLRGKYTLTQVFQLSSEWSFFGGRWSTTLLSSSVKLVQTWCCFELSAKLLSVLREHYDATLLAISDQKPLSTEVSRL